MSFRIASAAVAYLQKYLIKPRAGECVVAIVPLMDVPAASESLEQSIRRGLKFIQSLPRETSLQWAVGSVEKNRVPAEYCKVIDGVTVYIPPEQEELLRNRILKFEDGTLRFDPPLEPYRVKLPDKN